MTEVLGMPAVEFLFVAGVLALVFANAFEALLNASPLRR
jgi:hypothetical protein